MSDLLGIIVGHAYYFLAVLHPRASGQDYLKTPAWVYPFELFSVAWNYCVFTLGVVKPVTCVFDFFLVLSHLHSHSQDIWGFRESEQALSNGFTSEMNFLYKTVCLNISCGKGHQFPLTRCFCRHKLVGKWSAAGPEAFSPPSQSPAAAAVRGVRSAFTGRSYRLNQ